jgi:phosphohistidine phosphatase
MKKLYLVRHAKSSWDDLSVSDFDRGLNQRGENDAPLMADVLKKEGVDPSLIISSPANRAITTAKILAEGLGYKKDIDIKESIYESSDFNLMMIIKELDEKLDSVMIVGHNPAMNDVINKISDLSIHNLPTCSVVALELLEGWSSLDPYKAKNIFYKYPKMFKD